MKLISLCALLIPGILAANPVAFPTTSYADAMLLPNWAIATYSDTVAVAQDSAVMTTDGPDSNLQFNANLTDVDPLSAPEPGDWTLVGAGLLGLGLLSRMPRLRP